MKIVRKTDLKDSCMNRNHNKKSIDKALLLILVLCSMILLCCILVVSAHLLNRKEWSPNEGRWETDDQSIVIWCKNRDPEATYVIVQDVKVYCSVENDRYTQTLLFWSDEAAPPVCEKGECFLAGKSIYIDDQNWLIKIDGVVYHLKRVA